MNSLLVAIISLPFHATVSSSRRNSPMEVKRPQNLINGRRQLELSPIWRLLRFITFIMLPVGQQFFFLLLLALIPILLAFSLDLFTAVLLLLVVSSNVLLGEFYCPVSGHLWEEENAAFPFDTFFRPSTVFVCLSHLPVALSD